VPVEDSLTPTAAVVFIRVPEPRTFSSSLLPINDPSVQWETVLPSKDITYGLAELLQQDESGGSQLFIYFILFYFILFCFFFACSHKSNFFLGLFLFSNFHRAIDSLVPCDRDLLC
jgi:hypothetical protein